MTILRRSLQFIILLLWLDSSIGLAAEVSLKEDQKSLEQLRSEVPEEKRQENDELGFILSLFSDFKRSPSQIQQEFGRWLEKAREKKRREWKTRLSDYTRAERLKRTEFLAQQKEKRRQFLQSKPDKSASDSFFAQEKAKSQAFFEEEREKRRDFQADLDGEKKSLESHWRDRRQQFNEKLREFKEIQKAEGQRSSEFGRPAPAVQLSPEHRTYLEDFEKIPKGAGEPLKPRESPSK